MTKTNRPAHPSTAYAAEHGANVLPLEWDILLGITFTENRPYDFFDDGVTEGSGIWHHWADEIADWLPITKTAARRTLDGMVTKGMLDSYLDDDFDGRHHKGTWFSLTADGADLALRIAQLDSRSYGDLKRPSRPEPEAAKGPSVDTGRTNTSHAGHDHPATAKARAACRKAQAAKA